MSFTYLIVPMHKYLPNYKMGVVIFWHGLSFYHPLKSRRKKASRHVARQLIALSFLSHLSTDSIPVVDDGGATFTVLDRRWRHPHDRRRWRHPHGARLTAAPSQCPTDNRLHRLPHITPRPGAGGDRSVCKDEHIDDVRSTVLHFPEDGAASVPVLQHG